MKTILVWRMSHHDGYRPQFEDGLEVCPYCATDLDYDLRDTEFIEHWRCELCGWRYRFASYAQSDAESSESVLRAFPLASVELQIHELGSHLRAHHDDITDISPRRFEELVRDIFRLANPRLRVVLTKQTRDRGVDVFLEDPESGRIVAIIQVKHSARGAPVGISAIQRLAGAALDWSSRRATLVTNTRVTQAGVESVKSICGEGHIELTFVEGDKLLPMLGVYNMELPSLSHLTDQARSSIIASNGKWRPSV